MTRTVAFAAALLLLAIAFVPVHGNASHFGVDDWTAEEIAAYLMDDVKVNVSATAIAALGLHGATLFAAAEIDFSGLDIKPAEAIAVKRSLIQLVNRVNSKPADFWEWRATNRRLFDYWILPLAMSPRALLIWSRFYDSNEAIDHINDEIDETPGWFFGLQWIFVPNYPIYQVVTKVADEHSHIDEISQYMFLVGIFTDVVVLIRLIFKKSLQTLIRHLVFHLAITLMAFACAAISHEFMWWMTPAFASNYFLYWNLYFSVPVFFVLFTIANFYSDSLFPGIGKRLPKDASGKTKFA